MNEQRKIDGITTEEDVVIYEESMEEAMELICQIYTMKSEGGTEKEEYKELWSKLRCFISQSFDEEGNIIDVKEENKLMYKKQKINNEEISRHKQEMGHLEVYTEMLREVLSELRYIKDDLIHYGHMNRIRQMVLDRITDKVWELENTLETTKLYHATMLVEAKREYLDNIM